MANLNDLDSNSDDCSYTTATKMASLQEEQQSVVVQEPRYLTLRKRSYKNDNTTKLSNVNNVEAMYKLLCKPVHVNITKLSLAELKQTSKRKLHKTQAKAKPIQKPQLKAQPNKIKTNNRTIIEKEDVNQSQVPKKQRKKETASTSRITKSGNNNLDKENLVKNIKQPYIKLHRIEKVINKIAQSFAKVITNKEIDADVPEPLNINTNKCLQTDTSEILTSESYINEPLQPNDSTDNDTDNFDVDELNKTISRRFKRKRKIVYHFDDDNKNDNLLKIFSKNAKMSKLSSPEEETENRAAGTECDAIDTKHIKEMKLNVSDKSLNVSNEHDLRTVLENVENVSPQNLNTIENVFPKSSPDHVTEKVTLKMLKQDNSVVAEEQTVNNKDTRLQIEESFISDKSSTGKYNLLKELRVYLIELNHIKYSTDNRYSSLEIEQLTRKYIEAWNSSKLVNIRQLPLIDKEMKVEQNDTKIDIEFVFNSNVCKFSDSKRANQKKILDNQEISNSFVKVSNKTSEPDTFNRSRKMFTSMTFNDSILRSSPIRSPTKTSADKSIRSKESKSSEADSVNNVYSQNKELPEILLYTSSPKKSRNTSSSEHVQARNIFFKKSVPAHNEKVLISGKKTFVTKIHAKTVNIINPKVNTKKNITTCHSMVVSPCKHKKSMDKRDGYKSIRYKCIVCDHYFENYGNLQHHLTRHTQKQTNVSLNSSKERTSAFDISEGSENLQESVFDSSESKKTESLVSEQESTEQAMSTCSSPESNKQQTNLHTSMKKLQAKRKDYFSKQRTKFMNMLCKPSECSICSKVFPTATDLAGHIFLHTEHELQSAFEQAKQKTTVSQEEEETEEPEKIKTGAKNSTVSEQKKSPVKFECNKSSEAQDSKISSKETATTSMATKSSLPTQIIAETVTATTAAEAAVVTTTTTVATTAAAITTTVTPTTTTIPVDTLIIGDILKAIKIPATNENNSKGAQSQSTQKLEKKKSKKSFKICSCQNKPEISDNCLQIEIVLLCHTCKILFRTIDCFDAHFDVSEYELCNKNRASGGRTPNLLCAMCGVMFKSVQNVRHHLENHVRVKQNCTMDFRCNICKVIFIGIGPLFYVHWSRHLQDPCWKADETTFSTNMVLNQTEETSGTSTENYIRVAEYVCQTCKIPFVTEGDLKRHNLKCKPLSPAVSVAGKRCSTSTEKPLEIEVNCSLCKDVFTEKLTFYKHIRNKHNFISEPQFVCVSLTVMKTAYICNICMEISESTDDFEDHWLKHSTATVYFTCAYCTKAFCNGLNAFLEHAKMHEVNVKQYVLSCTINYADAEFVCKHCTIGFETEKSFNEHNIIHKPNQILTNSKNDKAQNQGASALDLNMSILLAEPDKQKEDLAQKEVSTSQSTQQKNDAGPTKSDTDKDKERLINILEGNEDDSEHELIIDWREKPEEENQLSEERKDKEKQAALNNVLNTYTKNNTVITSTKNVAQAFSQSSTVSVSFKNIIPTSSQSDTKIPETHISTVESPLILIDDDMVEIPQEPKSSNIQNVENNSASGSSKNQEQPTVLKKNSPVKPRRGFLRVKTLAELTNRPEPIKAELPEHSSTCPVSNQQDKQDESDSIAFRSGSVFGNQATPPTTSVINNQQLNQTQMKANQGKHYAFFNQNSTPAYHKNLPACNIFRSASAVPRPGQRNENASTKVAASCSDVQDQRAVHAASTFTSNSSLASLNSTEYSNQVASSPQPTQVRNTNPAYKGQQVVRENKERDNVGSPLTAPNIASANNSQHSEQYEATSSNVNYQYPYLVTANSTRGSDVLQKGQQMVITPPMTGDTSTIYYKNPNGTSGGMSIVINQTMPAVQNMPTINIVGQEQQPVYQPQVYTESTLILDHSHVRQAQNVTDFSTSSNVYQIVTNEYQVPNRESVPTYKLNLQPPLLLCSYCPEVISFTSAIQLELHLNLIHNFVCSICGQRSHSFNELTIHKTKHGFI